MPRNWPTQTRPIAAGLGLPQFRDPFASIEDPIRGEIYSESGMLQLAEQLAARHAGAAAVPTAAGLVRRLKHNRRVLMAAYRVIGEAAAQQRALTPAAELLLDNFQIVDNQLRALTDRLTSAYFRRLPGVSSPPHPSHPRLYDIAQQVVAHRDSLIEIEPLTTFIEVYQQTLPLTLAELRGMPDALSLVLLENLRRIAAAIASADRARSRADRVADQLLGLEGKSPDRAMAKLPGLTRERAAVVQLVYRLRDQATQAAQAIAWLTQHLAAQGTTPQKLIQDEHSRQTAAQATVRNIMTSLQRIATFDWNFFLERVSRVDAILQADSLFSDMDATTRERYRHSLEELAAGSELSEEAVARAVMSRTEQAGLRIGTEEGADWRLLDPGYYLISRGRGAFEREIGFRPSLGRRLMRLYMAHALPAYQANLLVISLLIIALPLLYMPAIPAGWLVLLMVLALFPAWDLAALLINRLMTALIPPRHLPRLELSAGIPPALRTCVVLPAQLTTRQGTGELLRLLEAHYLGNPRGAVHYVLLSDWTDGEQALVPGDLELLQHARQGIAELNRRHGTLNDGETRFLIFQRPRVWNHPRKAWTPRAGRRGALLEFNRLLSGEEADFLSDSGRAIAPAHCRYMITLPPDSRMPVNTVVELVGSMAHPLNLPRLDPHMGRVVEGYGMLQPAQVSTFPWSGGRSAFHRLFAGPCGLDPQACPPSDIFQNLFGEGVSLGSGVHDVEVMQAVVNSCGEERVTLHDLLPGAMLRCGLAHDLPLLRSFPNHLLQASRQLQEQISDDWRLMPWITGRQRGGISIITRWRIFDRLRQSLTAPAMLGMLTVAWALPQANPMAWMVLVLASLGLPALFAMAPLGTSRRHMPVAMRLWATANALLLAIGQGAVSTALLAHQAALSLKSIGTSLLHTPLTPPPPLKWPDTVLLFLRQMVAGETLALASGVAVVVANPAMLPVAAPLLVLWLVSPWLGQQLSRPTASTSAEKIAPADTLLLRCFGRRVWRYLSRVVTENENWLPPDMVREEPAPGIDRHCSPASAGLYLLSAAAARDCGWLGLADLLEGLEKSVASLAGLTRLRGLFFSSYDTEQLRPVEPGYISTADNGNLAALLLTLCQYCREAHDLPPVASSTFGGVADTLSLLRYSLQQAERTFPVQYWKGTLDGLERQLSVPPATLPEQAGLWRDLESQVELFVEELSLFAVRGRGHQQDEVLMWVTCLREDIGSHRRDIELFFPWAASLNELMLHTSRSLNTPRQQLWHRLMHGMDAGVSLAGLAGLYDTADDILAQLLAQEQGEQQEALLGLKENFHQARRCCSAFQQRLSAITARCEELVGSMDFTLLYDKHSRLFSQGWHVAGERLDNHYHELLASEACLCSFIAIARGNVSPEHWYRLGRPLVPVGRAAALASRFGAMSEYLMPGLLMRPPDESLLDQACQRAIQAQISYGKKNRLPWGMSHSAFNLRDLSEAHRTASFGIPALGLERGLGQDMVVAPYATALAAMYRPASAADNLRHLDRLGAGGPEGYYEALDFTPDRLPEGSRLAVIKAYLSRHQGMSLIALDNVLHDGLMQRRFHRNPLVRGTELLLQEAMPQRAGVARPPAWQDHVTRSRQAVPPLLRRFSTPHERLPATHLLCNGHYAVMITAAGGGFSRWRGLALTRWREDPARDIWGNHIFLRDRESGLVWSAAYQPSGREAQRYEAVFTEERARIVRSDRDMTSTLDVVIAPDGDVELRRLSLFNRSASFRIIEITSYSELVLAPQQTDLEQACPTTPLHTEYDLQSSCLLAGREPPSPTPLWVAHSVRVRGRNIGQLEFETERLRFIGRGNTVRRPAAVMSGEALSNTAGLVFDPIFSLRVTLRIAPGSTSHVTFATMAAPSRQEVLGLVDRYSGGAIFEHTADQSWQHARMQLSHLGIDQGEAHLFQHLANRLLYSDPSSAGSNQQIERSPSSMAARLQRHGLSEKLPLALLRIQDGDDLEIVRQLLAAHQYWNAKSLDIQLVILNETIPSAGELQPALEAMVEVRRAMGRTSRESGTIRVLAADRADPQDLAVLVAGARLVLVGREGSLSEQVTRMRRQELRSIPPGQRQFPRHAGEEEDTSLPLPDLEFFNGLGGFAAHGKEYLVTLDEDRTTPAAWLNVMANSHFATAVSVSGASCSWSEDSLTNLLTPWFEDRIQEPVGELLYLKDLNNGHLWSPVTVPIRVRRGAYLASHGQGWSRWEHLSHGIWSELVQFVPRQDPLKIFLLTLENRTQQSRRISATLYVEWVLGSSRYAGAPPLHTNQDPASLALFAHNPWDSARSSAVAFMDLGGTQLAWTADRIEFIGRNGTLEQPAALIRENGLTGRSGSGLDPCGALQTVLELAPGQRIEIRGLLGQAEDREMARSLVHTWRSADLRGELAAVQAMWQARLQAVQVSTPDRALDLALNYWFPHQSLICHAPSHPPWYRKNQGLDCLADCLALVHCAPELVTERIVAAAGGYLTAAGSGEGSGQEAGGKTGGGEALWLPYTLSRYIEITGDLEILQAPVGEDGSHKSGLYECCRGILEQAGLTGPHGLTLAGGGRLDRGLNRIGQSADWESVWRTWLFLATLHGFIPLAVKRGEHRQAEAWQTLRRALSEALERAAWDGGWYRRGLYEDGTLIGSGTACRIESASQSWSVISGSAVTPHCHQAMDALLQHLVQPDQGLALLLAPPFTTDHPQPVQAAAFPPGFGNNGGHDSTVAAWAVIALAMLGRGNQAHSLFSMLNPITRTAESTDMQRYRQEPYLVCSELASLPLHPGEGVGSWQPAAGWLYRAGLESILGLRVRQGRLGLEPSIPEQWPSFSISYRHGRTLYRIQVHNPQGISQGVVSRHLDDLAVTTADGMVELIDDGIEHLLVITLG